MTEQVEVLRWEGPPSEHGNTGRKPPTKYEAVANALRARPGEWAVIAEGITAGHAGKVSHGIRNGTPWPFAPPRHFEAKAIGPARGSLSKIYARYVGGEVTE